MSEPRGMPPGGAEPDEQEVRAYLERLRSAPVEEVLAELLSILLSAAQVKLGRSDARLLLDALGAIAEVTDGRIDRGLHEQVTSALSQLRLAQVEAERQLGAQVGEEAATGAAGATGVPGAAGPEGSPSEAAQSAPPSTPSGRSRLWVPGA